MNSMIRTTASQLALERLAALGSTPLDRASALPGELYVSQEILELERSCIFASSWYCAGRADELPGKGDYKTFELGEQPVLLVRGKDGAIHAMANVCRHRMMRLVDGRGNSSGFVCPYHAWTYDIGGQLVAAPHMERSACFDIASTSLARLRCETYAGWIYVNLDETAPGIASQLGELDAITSRYRQEDYVTIFTEEQVWDANWKCIAENFMESYHLPVAHANTVGAHYSPKENEFDDRGAFDAFTYQLFTKSEGAPVGRAHKDNTHLEGRWRNTSVMPTVFPTHMYVLAPDHLWYLALQEDGVGRTRMIYGAAVAPERLAAEADRPGYIADTKAFLDRVQREDRELVEGIQRGARSPLASAGPLSWLEREPHEFARYLAGRLCG